MSMFASTYVCDKLFSFMDFSKSQFQSQFKNAHLNSMLKVVTAQSLVLDINMLTNAKRFQVSSSRSTINK